MHFNSFSNLITKFRKKNYSTSSTFESKSQYIPSFFFLRTSKYSHTSYSKQKPHFNSSRLPILGFYNNRGRSNMSRYTRVFGSNSLLVSRYYATSDSIRTVTTSRRDCLNCDHLPAPIATILHAASARSRN